MRVAIHICAKDASLFHLWWKHASGLQSGTDRIEVWAEPGVIVPRADLRFKSELGYPEVCSHIWHTIVTSSGGPVLYLEPDCWPTRTNWIELLEEEYSRLGEPSAMITSDYNPPNDLVGGIGIYHPGKLPIPSKFEDLAQMIPEGCAFDTWIPTNAGVEKTDLIRHSYAIYDEYGVSGWHAFGSQTTFDLKVGQGALFHKDPTGSVTRWVK